MYKHIKDLKSFFEHQIELINMVIDNTPLANNWEISVLKENLSEIENYYNVTKRELTSAKKWYNQANKSVPGSTIRKEEEERSQVIKDEVISELKKKIRNEIRGKTKLLIDVENREIILNGKEYLKCTPIVLFIITILYESDQPLHQNKIKTLIKNNSLFQNKSIPYNKSLNDFFRHTITGKELYKKLIKKEGKGYYSLKYNS